jgi:hypothetical protein
MNPAYDFARMRELLDEYKPSRERSLAATKLDECELWLTRCQPAEEARARDMTAPAPAATEWPAGTVAAIGYQGPAAHTYTPMCAGHHPPMEPCPPAAPGQPS